MIVIPPRRPANASVASVCRVGSSVVTTSCGRRPGRWAINRLPVALCACSVIDGTPPSTGFSDCSSPPWPYMELADQPSATRCLRSAAVCGARTKPVSV